MLRTGDPYPTVGGNGDKVLSRLGISHTPRSDSALLYPRVGTLVPSRIVLAPWPGTKGVDN